VCAFVCVFARVCWCACVSRVNENTRTNRHSPPDVRAHVHVHRRAASQTTRHLVLLQQRRNMLRHVMDRPTPPRVHTPLSPFPISLASLPHQHPTCTHCLFRGCASIAAAISSRSFRHSPRDIAGDTLGTAQIPAGAARDRRRERGRVRCLKHARSRGLQVRATRACASSVCVCVCVSCRGLRGGVLFCGNGG